MAKVGLISVSVAIIDVFSPPIENQIDRHVSRAFAALTHSSQPVVLETNAALGYSNLQHASKSTKTTSLVLVSSLGNHCLVHGWA